MVENIIETVNVNGEPDNNGGRQMIEKRMSLPHTITLPHLKTCTTGTKLESLWVSFIEDNTATGVLGKGAVHDNMSWVVTKGTEMVWTIAGGVVEVVAKRTIVSHAMVLRVARGTLVTVRVLVLWAVDMKMPHDVAVKTNSLVSRCRLWAYMGVLRCNSTRVRGGTALMKGRTRVSGDIQQDSGSRQWRGTGVSRLRVGEGAQGVGMGRTRGGDEI